MAPAVFIFLEWSSKSFCTLLSHWGFVPQIWRQICVHDTGICDARIEAVYKTKMLWICWNPVCFFLRSYSYYLRLLNNLRIAKDFFVANMWGRRVTNCFISWIVLSPWRSSNWADISLAFLLSAGPTALKFLSLDFNDKSLLVWNGILVHL